MTCAATKYWTGSACAACGSSAACTANLPVTLVCTQAVPTDRSTAGADATCSCSAEEYWDGFACTACAAACAADTHVMTTDCDPTSYTAGAGNRVCQTCADKLSIPGCKTCNSAACLTCDYAGGFYSTVPSS